MCQQLTTQAGMLSVLGYAAGSKHVKPPGEWAMVLVKLQGYDCNSVDLGYL